METKIKNGVITISMPLQKPKKSTTGKSFVIATSRGKQQTTLTMDGKPVCVVANAFLEIDEVEQQGTKHKKKRSKG
jgi:hypothetical protein